MADPKPALECEISPSMHLDDIFLCFLGRFNVLPNPRSVAEIRITIKEIGALKQWFSELWGLPRMWCDSTFRVSEEVSASRREMFGALLLILASEVCRDSSNEEAVWPAVTAVLKTDKISFPALFVAGQPTVACKVALAAGARRLGLRNLIDRHGAQEYFDTLKLQFGFTLKGAVRRLPEWLDGLGAPVAAKILSGAETGFGDLGSSSFTELWEGLRDFRHGRISERYASAVLQVSPWIRPEWTAELLRVARLRLSRTSSASAASTTDYTDEPVCEPILRWDSVGPKLALRLNEERIYEILGERDSSTFAIDRQVVDRWTREEAGWRGRREIPCQSEGSKPNLRPMLLSVGSEEIDLREMGMGEPLLIFDLRNGTLVDPSARFDLGRDYGLICDADLTVPGVNATLKAAYRLVAPWDRDVRVKCAGALYWQPRIDERERLQPIRLALESPRGEVAEIGSACRVCVTGDVPNDVKAISLMVGDRSYSVIRHDGVWETELPVEVTLGMALGEERVRVRVESEDFSRAVAPKISLSLRGIASRGDSERQWELLNLDRAMNRAGGVGTARVFAKTVESQLYEGPYLVRRKISRALPLRDLLGWGDPLIVRSEGQSASVLVESVEDRGSVGLCYAGRLNEIHLRWPIELSADHEVLVWSDINVSPRRITSPEVSDASDGSIWKLPALGNVAAIAISYRGEWIGSYWKPEPMILALNRAASTKLFALFRWLKIPVLNPSFRAPMAQAVARSPDNFVGGWLRNESLPYSLVHRQAEQGLDTVVRAFLWNYAERNEIKTDRLARAFPMREGQSDDFKSSLVRLGETCPSLAYSLARSKLRGRPYWKFVRAVVASFLRQPEAADLTQLWSHLIGDRRDCADLIGIAPESLETCVNAFGDHLDKPAADCGQAEPVVRRLGETSKGRPFLAASLLLRLLAANQWMR